MMKAKLTYFKPSGKFYSEGELEVKDSGPLHEIWWQVRDLKRTRQLPGLIANHSDFIVLCEVPGHEHDHPRIFPAEAS